MKKIIWVASSIAAIAFGVPAAAITTFATFSPLSNAANISFTGSNTGAGTLSSVNTPVTFRFLDASGTTSVFDVASMFNLSATTTSGIVAGGVGIVPVSSGTLSFTSAAATTYNGHTGTNLLTAAFTGGALTGLIGGSVASYINSQPPSAVTFTSDFFDFSTTTARDISLAINAINPSIAASAGGVANFDGTVSGNFGADLAAGSGSTVPEPASWALLIAGFGLVGAVARRRATISKVAA